MDQDTDNTTNNLTNDSSTETQTSTRNQIFSSETSPAQEKPNQKNLIIGIIIGVCLLIGGLVIFLLNKAKTAFDEENTYSGYTLDELGLDENASEEEINARVSEMQREEDRVDFTSLLNEDNLAIFRSDSFFEGYDEMSVDMVDDTIHNFFSETYPEYESIDFVKDSLKDDTFELLSNTGEKYSVKITTSVDNSKKTITYISIHDSSGKEVLGYDGRFYEGTKLIIEGDGEELFSGEEDIIQSDADYFDILDENGKDIFKDDA